jgi:hypothetical protein
LKDSLTAWINEPDVAVRAPDFIVLAEAQINRRISHPQFVNIVSLTTSTDRVALPTDFLAVKSLRIDGAPRPKLDYVTPDMYADRFGDNGTPERYTLAAGYILFDPMPSSATTMTLYYARQVDALALNGDNWLLDNYPDLYLYGALAQAAPYLEDEKRGAVWAALFENAMTEVNRDGQRQALGGTLQTNNGQPRTY